MLFGCAGSGKTCTMHVILDEDPPDEYTSTPLAVRPVKVYRVDMTPSQWKKLSRKEQDLVIAKACYSEEAVDLSQIPVELHEAPQIQRPHSNTSSLVPHDKEVKGKSIQPMSTDATHTSSASRHDIAVRAKGEVTPVLPSLETYNDLLSHMEDCLADGAVVEIKRVQVSDCGGQPQFHEILPIFLRGTSLYIFVFKLNEELGARPMIKYHLDGKAICKPYECSETYEQILEHCLRVVRSQKATDEKSKPPRIMIIGTHKDKEHECTTETREVKNKRFAELLLPEFKREVLYYRPAPPQELIYALNAKDPGEEEKCTADRIRLQVSTECIAEAVEIPLQWHALEGALEDLAKAFKRDVLSKEECFAAAQALHFEDEFALDAALNYLDQFNLIFYYPEILPGVVFASAQVLLDKVTELVVAAHELRDGKTATAMSKMPDDKWQRFIVHALVSAEFLAQEDFQKHYKPGLFDHDDLILLFKELLIFAVFNETEVFVPALLQRLKTEEIDKHRVSCSSSAASPLVLTFPKHGGPLLGVFCASVVALLSEDNIHPCAWNLKMEEDRITPGCLYRNCVQFTIPDCPGSVVVIDSFEYIEVHVHITSKAASKLKDFAKFCQTVRCGVIRAIRTATTALNYDYHEPSVHFMCPCKHPGLHVATIKADSNLWICSKNSDECDEVAANQRVWLTEDKDVVSHTPKEHKPVPPSVALTLNQQETSSDTTPALRTFDSTSEQHGSVIVDSQHLKDSSTAMNNQQRALESTPQRSYHESSPTIRLVPQEGASSANIDPTPQTETSPNANVHIDSTPKLHQLGYLKHHNRTIKVIECVAFKWEHVATQLYFEGHLINTIKRDSHHQVDSACRDMFIKWLEGAGRKPITWTTLIDALCEAGLSRVADDLNSIINSDTQESQFQEMGTTTRWRVICNI